MMTTTKRALVLLTLAIATLVCITLIYAQESEFKQFVYLPLIQGSGPPVPTSTPTPTLTSTPMSTLQPVYELLNGNFENGRDGSWTEHYENETLYSHLINTYMQLWRQPDVEGYGSWLGWLGGYHHSNSPLYDTTTAIEQLITVPPDSYLCFEYQIYSEAWWGEGGDSTTLFLDGTTLASWDVDSSADNGNWHEMCIDLKGWQGETISLRFEMVNDFIWRGDFYVDNIEFRPIEAPTETPTSIPTATPTASPTSTPMYTPTSTLAPIPTATSTEEPCEVLLLSRYVVVDTVWQANCTYIAPDGVYVNPEVILTISEGTTVLMGSWKTFHVYGSLMVAGTVEKPVVIRRQFEDLSWTGLAIQSSLNAPENTLRYLTVEGSHSGITTFSGITSIVNCSFYGWRP